MTIRSVLRMYLLAGSASLPAGLAHASSFALREGSTDWMANAFAGDTAKSYDSATVWANPAGMVRLNQNEVSAAVNGIFANGTFSGANHVGPTAITPGTTGGNVVEPAATGAAFGVWNYRPDLKFGFATVSPFGQRVSNGGDFVGRYQSLVSSITDVAFTAAIAYRVNEKLSIGGGPVIDYFASRLTQAINIGPASAITGDPTADLHGDDVSAGYNLGALYQFTPDLRLGVDYHSRIRHSITGTQSIAVPALLGALSPLTAAQLNTLNTSARTSITLPDSALIGVYYQINPQWAVMSDVSWTDWSLIQSINITPTTPGIAGTVINENWHNTWAVSVGANYRANDKLLLQGGVGFDESPVTNSNRTSRIPDSNRYLINIGAQYDIVPNLTLQLAYSHIFFSGAPIENSASPTAGVLIGKYSTGADTASAGITYRF